MGTKKTSRGNVTLLTLAKELGVSRATISNAYSRPRHVSAELREKIFARAEELGYAGPHAGARALRTGKASSIGVIFTESLSYAFADPSASIFLEGLAHSIEGMQTGMLVISAGQAGSELEVVERAVVDGFIIYSTPNTDHLVPAVIRRGQPVICVDDPHLSGVPLVGIDDTAAARAIVEHLIELGHRDIAAITWIPSAQRSMRVLVASEGDRLPHGVSRARWNGWRDGCVASGLKPPLLLQASHNTAEAAAEAARFLLRQAQPPTAVVCVGDVLADGVIRAAIESGVEVPAQLSVTGFDDLFHAGRMKPALTTVHQPIYEKGFEAGELMKKSLAGETVSARTELPWTLQVRESTASPEGSRPVHW